jgi:menaquinol-cytochrome c reductase cytochrome b/c subunit
VPEIPESLLRRSAEAKAKALGVPVEQVLAEMKGEGPPVEVTPTEPSAPESAAVVEEGPPAGATAGEPEPVEETPPAGAETIETPEIEADTSQEIAPAPPTEGEAPTTPPEAGAAEEEETVSAGAETAAVATATAPVGAEEAEVETEEVTEEEPIPAVDIAETEELSGNGSGKVAAVVSPRPSVPPAGLPEGVRTQRLLTVVKARAIQNVKAEPHDKVNTWPHLMLMEFGALLAITGLLVILAVIIHSPLLDPANFNQTPNPSKAPWYFLGLQELLSYFDPQIAGVMVPTFTGMIGFMMIPYVDRNPSTRPSDRKFAILLYSIFLAGAATLTMFGVLFRGHGFNFSYPWKDGIFFDDLKDWVQFE